MGKSKKKDKIRVLDQWFYQVEEKEIVGNNKEEKPKKKNRIVYNTEGKVKPKKKNYMKLIIYENTAIIEWWEGTHKASSLTLNKENNTWIFQESIPETIYMNKIPKSDILISFTVTQEDKNPGSFTFSWKPKFKRRTKRKHLEEDLKTDIESVESKRKVYVEQLIKHIKAHKDLVEYDLKEEPNTKEEIKEEVTEEIEKVEIKEESPVLESRSNITNLKVPEVIAVGDRYYEFIRCTPEYYRYEYEDDWEKRTANVKEENGVYNIDIIFGAFKETSNGKKLEKKYALNIGYNGNFEVEFGTLDKSSIVIDTPTILHYDEKGRKSTQMKLNDAKFFKKTISNLDSNDNIHVVSSSIVIETEKEQYILESKHTRYYQDENEADYYISGADYGMLDHIANLAPYIYNNISEEFSKVKQK